MTSAGSVSKSEQPVVAITREVPGVARVDGAAVRVARGNPRLSRSELLEFVRGATVIGSMFHDAVNDELLDAAGPQLKGVCNYAVGVDNIDFAACARRGLIVASTPDVVTEGTANMAMGLILAVARRFIEGDRFVRSGEWAKRNDVHAGSWLGMHLSGQTLLIVGAGRIGKAVALRALAFGMRIEYVARRDHIDFEIAPLAARRVELDEGLRRADVVSIHTPLSPATRHLIDERRLGLLKPTAIIVNTARGPVIDEAALVKALRERRIWGAGLDVLEREPELTPGLAELDNVTFMPHVGSAEKFWRERMTQLVCENAAAIIAGTRPPGLVRVE